jgi:hypothetical protein
MTFYGRHQNMAMARAIEDLRDVCAELAQRGCVVLAVRAADVQIGRASCRERVS